MRKNFKLSALTFIVILFFLNNGCKEPENKTESVDQLTKTEIKVIDAAGIDSISTFKDALFPDGSSISEWDSLNDAGYVLFPKVEKHSILSSSEKKKLLLDRMYKAGFFLSNDRNFSYPTQPNGLAYVLGSKKINNPSKFAGNTCQEPLYGLDCSGMIYQMAIGSSLKLVEGGTANYVNLSAWNTAFQNSPDYQGLEMTDLKALAVSKMEAGDIIVAYQKHIGLVFDNGGVLGIFNSLGSGENTCSENKISSRGPVITKNIPGWWIDIVGADYHVLRVKSQTAVINNTKWDVTILFSANANWHADVTFNTDGTTTYDEPEYPGLYTSHGKWSMIDDKLHWSIGLDPNYIFDGLVSENKMSGSFIFGGKKRNWSAIKK